MPSPSTALITVYCITHKPSGRRYIGQTRRKLRDRWQDHWAKSKRSPLALLIREEGGSAFTIEPLEVCGTQEAANETEIRWISTYRTTDPVLGFNTSTGGHYPPFFVAGVKGPKRPSRQVPLTQIALRLPEMLRDSLKARARAKNVTFGALLVQILTEYDADL